MVLDLTGAQLKQVLEEQYQPVAARGTRPMLALGVSEGFTYTWDATQPQGSRVVPGSMMLNGTPIADGSTYRVATLNFLADGGDLFTVANFTAAILDVPFASSGNDDERSFVANTEKIPPKNTYVTVTLRPAKAPAPPRP